MADCSYRTLTVVILLLVFSRTAGHAANSCIDAADRVAKSKGIPTAILRAVTLAETGRGAGHGEMTPWPWAIQTGGKGYWFDTAPEALALVEQQLAKGIRNVDLGCFQLNYGWHGAHFSGPAEMLEPEANAAYAADYLLRLYQETGDWRAAVGLYHSRDPESAERYVTRLKSLYTAQTNNQTDSVSAPPVRQRPGEALRVATDTPRPTFQTARGPLIEARARPLIEMP